MKHLFKVSVNIEKFSNKRAFSLAPPTFVVSPAQAQPGLSELNRLLEKEKYFRPKVEYFSQIVASNEDYTAISQTLAIFQETMQRRRRKSDISVLEKERIYELHLWSLLYDAQMHSPS